MLDGRFPIIVASLISNWNPFHFQPLWKTRTKTKTKTNYLNLNYSLNNPTFIKDFCSVGVVCIKVFPVRVSESQDTSLLREIFLPQYFHTVQICWDFLGLPSRMHPYILKPRVLVIRTPQTIWIFCKIIVWERKNYQLWIVSLRAKALKMWQNIVKKCHKCLMDMFFLSDSPILHILGIFLMIYTLLSQNFDVKIYALFPNFFLTEKQTPRTLSLLECMHAPRIQFTYIHILEFGLKV